MLNFAVLAPETAPINRLHPLSKVAATAVISLTAVTALDWLTPLLLFMAELAVLPATGIHIGRLLRRGRVIALTALTVGVVNLVFDGQDDGKMLLDTALLHITTGNVEAGASLAFRVLAIAASGLIALSTIDPTELADGLSQQLRVPPRFAIGALAAFRLLPLLAREWRMISLARRARGLGGGANPVVRLRLFASATFVLLVSAIRRGTRLAVAMDARGFDASVPRGIARPMRMRRRDATVVAVTVAVCAAIIAIAIDLGVYTFVFF